MTHVRQEMEEESLYCNEKLCEPSIKRQRVRRRLFQYDEYLPVELQPRKQSVVLRPNPQPREEASPSDNSLKRRGAAYFKRNSDGSIRPYQSDNVQELQASREKPVSNVPQVLYVPCHCHSQLKGAAGREPGMVFSSTGETSRRRSPSTPCFRASDQAGVLWRKGNAEASKPIEVRSASTGEARQLPSLQEHSQVSGVHRQDRRSYNRRDKPGADAKKTIRVQRIDKSGRISDGQLSPNSGRKRTPWLRSNTSEQDEGNANVPQVHSARPTVDSSLSIAFDFKDVLSRDNQAMLMAQYESSGTTEESPAQDQTTLPFWTPEDWQNLFDCGIDE